MSFPPLLNLGLNEDRYREYFEQTYCLGPILTFDGIDVRFRKSDFDHCCFKSSRGNRLKDLFDIFRARRLGWIKEALKSADAQLRVGWNRDRKCYDPKRRVAVVYDDYVVVIVITGQSKARFITAYKTEDYSTIKKVLAGPVWAP